MALKTLHTLIKLHKRRVDVIRREMIAVEEERKQLVQLSERLTRELTQEMQLAAADPKIAGFFGAYAKRVKERQEKIAVEVKRLDGVIAEKAQAIREEFGEQKKFEIAREHARKRMSDEAKLRVQQRFDEIATQQYIKMNNSTV